MKPFDTDSEHLTLGDLVIENGTDIVLLHGFLEISKDRATLLRLELLEEFIRAAKEEILKIENLPDKAERRVNAPEIVDNPFD